MLRGGVCVAAQLLRLSLSTSEAFLAPNSDLEGELMMESADMALMYDRHKASTDLEWGLALAKEQISQTLGSFVFSWTAVPISWAIGVLAVRCREAEKASAPLINNMNTILSSIWYP